MRKTFAKVAQELVARDSQVAVLLGDIGVFAFRESLKSHPDRVFNMGILEQSMIGIAAGLAKSGFFPIVHTIAPFLVERAHEQLKVDFGYQELPGNFVSVGASADYTSLGGTHHCPADVETLLGIPGFQICLPGHPLELESQLLKYYRNPLPTYYRISENSNTFSNEHCNMTVQRIKEGRRASIIAVGPYLQRTLDATADLDFEIIYLNQISESTSLELSKTISNSRVFLIEPFYEGTLNRIVNEALVNRLISVTSIGFPRRFIHTYGTLSQLENVIGLTSVGLRSKILRVMDDQTL